MKTTTLKTAVSFLLTISCGMHATAKEHTPAKSGSTLPAGFKPKQTSAVTFTENKGQVSDQNYKPRPDVLFSGNTNGLSYHIRNTGISYQLTRVDSWKNKEADKRLPKQLQAPNHKENEAQQVPDKTTLYQVDIAWLNQNNNFTVKKGDALPGYDNYYLTACRNGALHVQTYTDVTLQNIYNGIDLHYYEKGGALEYDYIVSPNADYHQVQLKIGGATGIKIQQDGSIVLTTPLGDITENAPVVYQQDKLLNAKWVIKNNTLSFEIEHYNPSLPLIIDPTVHPNRNWGTYYGATLNTVYGTSCTTDAANNVYMTGYVSESGAYIILDTIASAGSHQTTFGGSGLYAQDAFLVKFNVDGVRLWGTYYGGSGSEISYSCATDPSGNIYMAGMTERSYMGTDTTGIDIYSSPYVGDTIATPGSHQPTSGGGSFYDQDAFLVKFNGDGIRQWATYYASSAYETCYSCATDATGNVYLCGSTGYSGITGDTIATAGSHQAINGGYNAFLVKFNTDGVRQWGTYYGGAAATEANACATDVGGNVYLAGTVYGVTEGDTIATTGSHQSVFGGKVYIGDAFLVKFNSDGVRQWGTYYGGSADEYPYSCTTDDSGNVFMSGTVNTFGNYHDSMGDTIATSGSHQPDYDGFFDAFLVKFNAEGVRQWGTFYGGEDWEDGRTCATDKTGNVYLTGQTKSSYPLHAIATVDGWQTNYGGEGAGTAFPEDAYLVKFNADGVRQWGTYYGGDADDEGFGCAIDQLGHVYMAGYSGISGTYGAEEGWGDYTTEIIATSNGWQPTMSNWRAHGYLVQFDDCTSSLDTVFIHQDGDTLFASTAAAYEWYLNDTLIVGATTQSYHPTENGIYTVCCKAHGETCTICSEPFALTTGINEHSLDNAISIYPNPNNGQYEIALQLNTQDNYTLELTNALGQVLYHEELKNFIGTYHKQLDETNYGAGIYLFRVKNSKEQSVKKVISF